VKTREAYLKLTKMSQETKTSWKLAIYGDLAALLLLASVLWPLCILILAFFRLSCLLFEHGAACLDSIERWVSKTEQNNRKQNIKKMKQTHKQKHTFS
jgi:hypothetical protein